MAAVTNKNTSQQGLLIPGSTGTQVTSFIPAPRVYVKSPDPVNAAVAPITKSNGATPTGWTDLGSLEGGVTVTYNKTKSDVTTGIDKKLRASYISQYSLDMTWNLLQMDDYITQKVLGLSPSIVVPGSVAGFSIGQEAFSQQALLIVYTNKLDNKEVQLYHPAAYIDATWAETQNAWVLKCDAKLPAFTLAGATNEQLVNKLIFNQNL